jgi:transcriptional regulator with XRE-family HTH domain
MEMPASLSDCIRTTNNCGCCVDAVVFSIKEKAVSKPTTDSVESMSEANVFSFKRRTVTVDGPDPIDRHVGGQLRLRRAQIGMTQVDLGSKLGLSFQAVQKYETGENRISASRLYQLARILEVSPAYFFEGIDESVAATPPAASPELARKEASMVLGAYYAISDPRLRAACLLIMTRMVAAPEAEGGGE